jgi:hypothetical protein
MLSTHPQFRPVYIGPTYRDQASSVKVRVPDPTGCTSKHVSIPKTLLSTGKAYLARIGRVHKFHRNTDSSGFIDNELLQLGKTPAADHSVFMRVPSKGFLANVCELFQPDHSGVCLYSIQNKLFGNFVILVPDSSFLISGKLSQFFVGASRCFRLSVILHTCMAKLFRVRPRLLRFLGQTPRHSANSAHSQIRAQTKLLAHLGVNQMVQFYRVMYFGLEGFLQNQIARFAKCLFGLQKGICSIFRTPQLTSDCASYHSQELYNQTKYFLNKKRGAAIPPSPKGLGFLAV